MAVYDRDYLTTLPLLYERASEYSYGDWNKYNDDVGDTILKLIASSSHTVDYYFRKFLTALILPNDDWDQKSLIWELTGYKPNYLRADYLMVQLYWPDCGLNDYVPVYQYTPFSIKADGKEYTFLCAQDYMLPPFTTRANIRLVNGTLETIDQDYTQVRNNKIKLTDGDIDYDLVSVVVSGIKWTQVRNVFYSPDTERIFSVHKESDGTYVYLHKSWQEYVDAYDTSFKVYFVQSYYDFEMFTDDCMKVAFKTELLTISGIDVSENYKIIPLLNSEEAIDATNLLPSTTEGNRAITTLDFETNAALFPGIASCKAYDWNTPEVCKTPYEVTLIACDTKRNLSEHMKMVLKSYLESICSPLINVNVVAPKFAKQDILVILDIGDLKGTVTEVELRNVVTMALQDFYSIDNMLPGRVVSTKELNSLILHTDSRIFFATTSFINAPVKSPMLIPVLGDVIIITEADAKAAYDKGKGDDKAYIGQRMVERFFYSERMHDVGIFYRFMLKANFLVPIDKLPVEVFDFVESKETSLPLLIGAGEFAAADFGYGEGFIHVLKTGGDPAGPQFAFVYETDGTAVIGKYVRRYIETTVRSELKFVNSQGTFYIDPYIDSLDLENGDIPEIKDALAQAFNAIPDLVDANSQPFNITGGDIQYTSPDPVNVAGSRQAVLGASDGFTGTKEKALGDSSSAPLITPEMISVGDSGTSTETPGIDAQKSYAPIVIDTGFGHERSAIESDVGTAFGKDTATVNERTFIYIPQNLILLRELANSYESSDVRKINFGINTYKEHTYRSYYGFTYSAPARYLLDPQAYGQMTFTANTYLSIVDVLEELVTSKPELYSETDSYMTEYYVRDRSGQPLTWYYVNTSPVQQVAGTFEIGYGIKVGFTLQRDTGVYVFTDPQTSRGFIYSSEMQLTDFTILED